MNHFAYTPVVEDNPQLKSRPLGDLVWIILFGYLGTTISGGCFGMILASRQGFVVGLIVGTIFAGFAGAFPFASLAVICGFCRSIPVHIACGLSGAAAGTISIMWLSKRSGDIEVIGLAAQCAAIGFVGGIIGAFLGSLGTSSTSQ